MTTVRSIIAAYTDAHGETVQLGYEQADSTWIDPPTVPGSDLAW